MNPLHERLGAALDGYAARFSGAEFADDRFGAVLGSVKRRRAARAAGVSSVSLVGAGALAVGAANVPWGSFVLGVSPAGSPSVVCTTATPDAAAESGGGAADNAVVDNTVVDNNRAAGDVLVVKLMGTEPSFGLDEQQTVATYELTVAGEPAAQIAQNLDGGFTAYYTDGTSEDLVQQPDGSYVAHLSDGSTIEIAVENGDLATAVTVTAPSVASPSPVVTCVTTTPEPGEKTTPTASPTPAPSQILTVTPTPSADVPAVSPFQCGFEFPAGELSNDDVAIGSTTWVPSGEAEAAIRAEYAEPEAAQLRLSGDQVPVTQIEVPLKQRGDNVPGILLSGDPAEVGTVSTADEFREAFGTYLVGVHYVLAADGTVVATGVPDGGNQAQYMTSSPLGAVLYGLDLSAGMVACDGVDEATLADAQVVVVAGLSSAAGDEIDGPHYAWRFLTTP